MRPMTAQNGVSVPRNIFGGQLADGRLTERLDIQCARYLDGKVLGVVVDAKGKVDAACGESSCETTQVGDAKTT